MYNKKDNRSTVAITKENIEVHGCYHNGLNKGGSTTAGVYTHVHCMCVCEGRG